MKNNISLIMPIFNGEKYLEKCLNSIVNAVNAVNAVNKFSIELITVDDGSTDNSKNIINKFAQKFNWIKYFYQENQGASTARNFGLEIANGIYIGFVDCDDEIKPEFFKVLQKSTLDKPDLVVFGHEKIIANTKVKKFSPEPKRELGGNEKLINVVDDKELFWYPWSKIYSYNLVKNICFDQKIKLGEDTIFNLYAVKNAKSIKRISNILYSYYENVGSLSSPSYKNGLLENMEYHFENRLKVHESLDSVIKLDISKYYLGHILPWLINNIMYLPENERKKELKRIAESNFFTTCTKWKWNVDSKGQYLIIFLLNSRMFNLLNFLLKIKYSSKS